MDHSTSVYQSLYNLKHFIFLVEQELNSSYSYDLMFEKSIKDGATMLLVPAFLAVMKHVFKAIYRLA